VSSKAKIDPAELPERLRAIPDLERLEAVLADFQVYLVGGVVRDALLGEAHPDLDLVVEDDIGAVADALGGEVIEHERFQTAKARFGDLSIDLARARAETYAHPGALPAVTPATLEDDLARRDFTINAMAVGLGGESKLLDPHGGIGDLGDGVLRVLHGESFRDDPTRALRAARYASRFDFDLAPETEGLLRDADLDTVSDDRIDAELRRLAEEPDPAAAIGLIVRWGILELPGDAVELVREAVGILGGEPWRDAAPRDDVVLAALGRGPGGVEARAAASALAEQTPERPSQAVEAASGRPPTELVLARAMGAEWLDRFVAEWRDVGLEIDGETLMSEGVPEGPAVGKGLEAALSAKLDGEISGRDEELRIALAAARGEIPED
jgi:tRNA nucleotidyltransferase (CCA-adding enzyme)